MGKSTRTVKTDLSVKLSDELAEDDRVHVVRQQMEQAPVSLGGKIMKTFTFKILKHHVWRTLLLLFVLIQRKLRPLMIFDCLDHFPCALSNLLKR